MLDFSWFSISLVVALLALWIAYSNYRRNNFPILKVVECEFSYSTAVDVNDGQLHGQFRLVVQNLGIPLHSLRLRVSYQANHGKMTVELTPASPAMLEGQFAKGMMAEFSLRTFSFKARENSRFLTDYLDARRKKLRLCVDASGFRVLEKRLDPWWTPIGKVWNRIMWKLNSYRTRRWTDKMKRYWLIPTFAIPSQKFAGFAKALNEKLT